MLFPFMHVLRKVYQLQKIDSVVLQGGLSKNDKKLSGCVCSLL